MNYTTPLDETILACVDCESTGLDTQSDRVLEVAVILFRGNSVLEEFQTLINPQRDIPETSYAIHKISSEMVAESPTIETVLPTVFKLLGNHPIIGHGIDFDLELLTQEAKRSNIPCNIQNNTRVDTVRLGRLYGESPSNSLEMLRSHFNIAEEGAHRAMSDVLVNVKVFQHLTQKYKTLNQVLEVLSKPILMKTMPLGKYRGRLFKDLPLDYIQWAMRQKFDQDLLFSLKLEFNRRKKGGLFTQVTNPFQSL